MSYLRLLGNAAWAGLYGSLLIAELIVFLNAGSPSQRPPGLVSLLAGVAAVYAPALALLFTTLFACVRFFAARRLGIGWLSPKAIIWFMAAVLGALTAVYYLNLRASASIVAPWTRDALRVACATMAGCWLIAMTAAVLAQLRPGRAGSPYRRAAAAFLLAAPAAVGLVLPGARSAAAPPGPRDAEPAPPAGGRAPDPGAAAGRQGLLLVGFEAASMDQVLPLSSARRLPTFERLLQEGAAARLDTIRPCRARVAWTALATGMPPWVSGVSDTRQWVLPGAAAPVRLLPRGLGMWRLVEVDVVREERIPEGTGSSRGIHDILRAAGFAVTVVGWPELEAAGPALVQPEDPRVTLRLERLMEGEGGEEPEGSALLVRRLREALARDLSARALALAALAAPAGPPRATAVRFPGLAAACSHFLRYHSPDAFGDVTPQEQAAFGGVLVRYYEMLDEMLAELIEAAGAGSFVMVVSAHGVEPLPEGARLARQLLPMARGLPGRDPTGSWRRGPDGVLLMHGPGVSRGARMDEADLLDVVPTILYVMGLPLGRDMPGGILSRLFSRDYLETHPVSFIPGYATSSP